MFLEPKIRICANFLGVPELSSEVEHRKFHTNMQKNFFMVRVTEPWNRLSREAVESPPMETFKAGLDTHLCDLLWGTCFSRGVRLDLLRPLPAPVILYYWEVSFSSPPLPALWSEVFIIMG